MKSGRFSLLACLGTLISLNAMADNVNAHSETFRDRQTLHFTNSGTHGVHLRFNFSYDYKCGDNIYTTWQHFSLQGASMDMGADTNGYAVYYFQPCGTSSQVKNEDFEWISAVWEGMGQATNIKPPHHGGAEQPEKPQEFVQQPQGQPLQQNNFETNNETPGGATQQTYPPTPPQPAPVILGSWARRMTFPLPGCTGCNTDVTIEVTYSNGALILDKHQTERVQGTTIEHDQEGGTFPLTEIDFTRSQRKQYDPAISLATKSGRYIDIQFKNSDYADAAWAQIKSLNPTPAAAVQEPAPQQDVGASRQPGPKKHIRRKKPKQPQPYSFNELPRGWPTTGSGELALDDDSASIKTAPTPEQPTALQKPASSPNGKVEL